MQRIIISAAPPGMSLLASAALEIGGYENRGVSWLLLLFATIWGAVALLLWLRGRDSGAERSSPQISPGQNRNQALVDMVNRFATQAIQAVKERSTELPDKEYRHARERVVETVFASTGVERDILERFEREANFVVNRWRKELEDNPAKDHRPVLRQLWTMQAEVGRALLNSGQSTTTYDRTDAVPRIRALLRAKSSDGLRLIRSEYTEAKPADLFYELEQWARDVLNLVGDAYGSSVRSNLRGFLGDGVRGFAPLIRELDALARDAEHLRLVDSFRFEDWETRQSTQHTEGSQSG